MTMDITKNDLGIEYKATENIVDDACLIIDSAQEYAYRSINTALVLRNWLLGKRISEEVLRGKERADYGEKIIKDLSKELTTKYGKGFDKTALYRYMDFFSTFPQIVASLWQQSKRILSWSHYKILLGVHDDKARVWYEKEALNEMWSVRTLERNVYSQYYFRLLNSQGTELNNYKGKHAAKEKNNKLEFIKNPMTLEFLNIPSQSSYHETDIESFIIDNLQKFLIELGKGYAFVARQQHIQTEKEDYYIDLVFYNYILKCFVLVDLKTKKITHQDVGQMDMYVRMYDELKRLPEDNPTIGIVLCSETDEDIARYSVLSDNKQLYASKYIAYMPTNEELKREIEVQKSIYQMNKRK